MSHLVTWRLKGQSQIRKTHFAEQPTEQEAIDRAVEAWGVEADRVVILEGAKQPPSEFRVVVTDKYGNVVFNESTEVDWPEGEHVSRAARRALRDVAESVRLGVI